MTAESKHISIRRAGAKDASVLSQMGKLTFTQSYASIIPAEELAIYTSRAFNLEQMGAELGDMEITYLLALAGMRPCGYSKLAPTPPPPAINGPNPVELARLYVLPEWTEKGSGPCSLKKVWPPLSNRVAVHAGYVSGREMSEPSGFIITGDFMRLAVSRIMLEDAPRWCC